MEPFDLRPPVGPRPLAGRAPLPSERPRPTDAAVHQTEQVADEPEDAVLAFSVDMLADAPAKGFDFERGMSRFPPLSIGLIVLLTLVFAWELSIGALANEAGIMRAGALERRAVLNGEVWRIATSIQLHASGDHLVGNCLALFLMGLAVEHAFGVVGAAAIYFAAGVAGALLCLVFEGGPTVGASGAIFGWWGAAIAFFYRHRRRLLTRDARVGFVLLIWAGWSIFSGFLSPHISNFSHLGGLLAGASLALLIPTRIPELHDSQRRT